MFRRLPAPQSTAPLAVLALAVISFGCSAYEPFEAEPHLRQQAEERLGPELAAGVELPFSLDDQILGATEGRLNPAASERHRTEAMLDFIFGYVDLQYSLTPTRDAVSTFVDAEGNCLSFVNLFVGLGREFRLNPFYVEVQDYQRWAYRDGVVVSRGHIVAGMYVDGKLETFDFLPYRPKSYRNFKPIQDVEAMAHYYNNLGAEALMGDDLGEARRQLEIASRLAPNFDKAINNYGVALLRTGDPEGAVEVLETGLALHPESVPLMTNLARVFQDLGRSEEALDLLERIEGSNLANPFFFVYRGDVALGGGDLPAALDYMRRALKADSEVPEVHLGLVRVYLAMGELDKARHHVERALKLDATHKEARKYAGMLARGVVDEQ